MAVPGRKDAPEPRNSREWEKDSKKPRLAHFPVRVVVCAFFTVVWV